MRVLFTSTAGLGHLLPLIPFAHALLAAGHDVEVACPAERAEHVSQTGLRHVVVDSPTEADRAAARHRLPSDDPGAMAAETFARLNPQAAIPKTEARVAEWRPDIIVSEAAEFAGGIVAERCNIPLVRVHPGAVHGWHWERLAGSILDGVRAQVGLPADKEARWLTTARQLCTFPAEFEAFKTSTPPVHRVRTRIWPEVSGANERGDTVYITFGTEISGMPIFPELARSAVHAVQRAGLHPLISVHNADLAQLSGLGDATVASWMDQYEVLPQVRAAICHGGSGTLLGALATGTPTVVIPFFADQPFNAERVVATKVGLSVAPGPGLDARLSHTLEQLLNEPRPGSSSMAAAIRNLPGIEAAVAVINSLAGK